MEKRRKCEICNVNVHGASYVKHMRSKKHLEKEKQIEMILPEWLFKEEQAPIENEFGKLFNPKTLKQLARRKIKLDDKELAKHMINPYYFTDKIIKIRFRINLESQNINHAKSISTITPYFPELGIEFRYTNKIIEKMFVIYARKKISLNLNITHCFQRAFIKLLKKIKEIMKLNYS